MSLTNCRYGGPIRWAKVAVASALMLFGFSNPADAKVTIDASPVVQVICDSGRGSAVKINDDTYISASHVTKMEGCKINGVAVEVLQDDAKDFSIFKGLASKGKARYTCRGFTSDSEYIAVGYGGGWPVLMYQPLRASVFKVKGEPYQMFTGEVIPGMSGGAVFDKRGRVVGIVNMRWPARSLPLSETSLCKKGI